MENPFGATQSVFRGYQEPVLVEPQAVVPPVQQPVQPQPQRQTPSVASNNPYLKYTQQPQDQQTQNQQPATTNPYAKYTDPNYSGPLTVKPEAPQTNEPLDAYHQQARAAIDANPDKFRLTGGLDPYLRRAGQGASLGWTDEISAGLAAARDVVKHGGSFGDNYSREKALQDELLKDANQQSGKVGSAIEFGASLPAYIGGGEIIGAATKAAPAVVSRVLSNPWVQDALLGATTGAIDAKGHGHDASSGAVGGAVGGVIGRGIGQGLGSGIDAATRGVKGLLAEPVEVDFQKLGADALNKFRTSGVQVSRDGLDEMANRFQSILKEGSYNKADMPNLEKPFAQWDRLTTGKGTMTPGGRMGHVANADELRNMFNALAEARGLGGDESRIAGGMRNVIQDVLSENNPKFIIGGDGKAAAQNWKEANRNFVQDFKRQAFNEAQQNAEDQASRSFFHANVETPLKTQAQRLRKERGDWTPAELQAIEQVYKPGPMSKLVSGIGRTAPTSGVIGPATMATNFAAGALSGGLPISAILAAAAQGSKALGDSMIKGRMNNVASVINNGGRPIINSPSQLAEFLSSSGPLAGMMSGEGIANNRNKQKVR